MISTRTKEHHDAYLRVTASCPIYFSLGIIATEKIPVYYAGTMNGTESKLSVSLTGEHKYNVHFFRWVQ